MLLFNPRIEKLNTIDRTIQEKIEASRSQIEAVEGRLKETLDKLANIATLVASMSNRVSSLSKEMGVLVEPTTEEPDGGQSPSSGGEELTPEANAEESVVVKEESAE